MSKKCFACNEGGYKHVMIKGKEIEEAKNLPLCKKHIKSLEKSVGDTHKCYLCDGMPSNELQMSNKRIGDYELGKGHNIIILCDKHIQKALEY